MFLTSEVPLWGLEAKPRPPLSLSTPPPPFSLSLHLSLGSVDRDWYFIVEQSAPAPHLAHLEG